MRLVGTELICKTSVTLTLHHLMTICMASNIKGNRERSGSVVECLTRD